MSMPSARSILAGAGLALFATLAAAAEEAPMHSGFLGGAEVYAKLEKVEIRKGVQAQRWIGPQLNATNFHSVLVDDVSFYPEAETGPQVSEDTLKQVREYLSTQLKERVGTVLTLASKPGPGVLRMQTAITGVSIKTEGMKPYEVVPVAAVFGGLKALSGNRAMEVHVFVEARFHDSQSGELVGVAMRELEGKDLKGKKDALTLADMRDSLDQATTDGSASLAMTLSEPAKQ